MPINSAASPRRLAGALPELVQPHAERAGGTRALLLRAIARAAAPRERATLPCFRPVRGRAATRLVDRREAEWIRLVTKGDRHAFLALLDSRGLTIADARRGLADAHVVDEASLPVWALDVLDLFSGELSERTAPLASEIPVPPFTLAELADAETLADLHSDPAAPWAQHAMFEPLLRLGSSSLQAAIARSGVSISAAAERRLLVTLAQRLSGACTTVLFHLVTPRDVREGHPGKVGKAVLAAFFVGDAPANEEWAQLFQTYPVLARLLAVVFRNWRDATSELIDRLSADHSALEHRFAGSALGALADCTQGIGDPHDHGRTVALLTFESGVRVVYKPKDLRVASAYMTLAHALNDSGLSPALPTRGILEGDGYTWEEFVAVRPCDSAEEVRRFYVQMGMHIRLVQLLDGTDFTSDNLIAAGDAPALVDLEALLSPRVPVHTDLSSVARETLLSASESPVRGCLVTAKIVGERGRRAAELGALAPLAECIAPFKQRILRRTPDGPALVEVYPEFPASRANPWLDGERVRSIDHLDAVVDGYLDMGEHLRRMQPQLADPDGPLALMHDVLVRCLCRDTHIYARMLQSSIKPARLRDSVYRELCLERMWLARFSTTAVVDAEIDSLRELDIPMFASRPGSPALMQGAVTLAEEFFDGTASHRLAERLAALPSTTRELDRDSIESVLFTLAPDVRRPFVAPTSSTRSEAPEWLRVAEGIGDEIVAASVGTAIEPAWMGPVYHPWSDSWSFSALGDDLFTGSAGVGLVLAELAAATGAPMFAAAARGALGAVGRRLAAVRSHVLADPMATPAGIVFGWSAGAYACSRAAEWLGDDALRSGPDALFRSLTDSGDAQLCMLLTSTGAWDVASGVAGLMLAALSGHGPRSRARTFVASVAGGMVTQHARAVVGDAPIYPPQAYPRSIASEAVGEAAALYRWQESLAPDDDAIAPLDLSNVLASATSAGDLLAVLSLARAGALDAARVLASVDVYLASAARDTDALAWLERGEVALAAHRVSGAAHHHAAAHAAGARLCDLKAATGRWIPESLCADRFNPSAFVGLGAFAHFFVQLGTPGWFASYRALE